MKYAAATLTVLLPQAAEVRPRSGDFVYSDEEIELMGADIAMLPNFEAGGIVIGALTPDGDIDMEACRKILRFNRGMDITFHRAFDMVRDPFRALDDVISLGCSRILTSGLARNAEEGIPMLRSLVEKAAGRISIMPGGGVTKDNARRILAETGAHEIHASARSKMASRMLFRNEKVNMGAAGADEYSRLVTDETVVFELKNTIN